MLQQGADPRRAPLGRSGFYELDSSGSSPFRLVFEGDDGTSIATEWILP